MKNILFVIVLSLILSVGFFGCSDIIDETEEALDEIGAAIKENSDEIAEGIDKTAEFVEGLELEKRVQDVTDAIKETDLDEKIAEGSEYIGEEIKDIIEGESTVVEVADESELPATDEFTLDIDGVYTTAEDVSLYIYLYDELPDNFMTKSEARELGWSGGGLEDYAPGMCIGGDKFGNYEGLLPKENGRTYTECDINTLGKSSRGAERIVFSNDGLIFYTDDHYESFVLLYDEEGKAA